MESKEKQRIEREGEGKAERNKERNGERSRSIQWNVSTWK